MTVKAPYVTSLRINKLSANQVSILWDNVGANFYYFVQIIQTRDAGVPIDITNLSWRPLGYTDENNWFEDQNILPNQYYKMRVAVAANGFEQSDWVETEEFQTFTVNAYTFEHMREFNLVTKFINEKFVNNNYDYIDFNRDDIQASLMTESFQFSPAYTDISSISNFILKADQYHEIQGPIQAVCVDKNRTMLAELNGVLYLFERFQPIVKVSNDKGQNWKSLKLFNDRIGNPVSRVVYYQSKTTTYVLGYDRVFYGRQSNDVRWSADDVKFSSQSVTFSKIGDQYNLGFDVEIFGTYAKLPAAVSQIAEAITVSDDFIYIAGRDRVYKAKTSNAPIDTTPGSPTFGEKLFESTYSNITGNPKAVCFKLDSVNGETFALITGEVKEEKMDPTVVSNVINSESKGVYKLKSDDTWERVFGNTEEERRRIEHGYTSMATDGIEVFISSSNYRYSVENDSELPLEFPNIVNSAVKYIFEEEFIHDKHYLMMSFRAGESSEYTKFEPGRMTYYAEPFFAWSRRDNTRCWITNANKAMVVYNDKLYQKSIDIYGSGSPDRIMHEHWDKGLVTVTSPNIEFTGFKKYASGIMIHKNTGELIGYFEFDYRVRDDVSIFWKPKEIMFTAELQNQERDVEWAPEVTNEERDPDLRPLLVKMMPESYLLQDTNFEKFCEYYLQFISDGSGTYYNNLLNLIKNKYPREEDSWEYLWSEIYKRNIYLSKTKRDEVVRFFESRATDLWSTKGTEASYKFLFKLLYNEDVQIDIESKNTTEYDIVVESDNINEDIVGTTIYTPTGRSNVTYIERSYSDGKLQWNITIHNLLGRFIAGQEIKSETQAFEGMIVRGVRGKDLMSNTIDYINRNRSYYVMTIKSNLPTSRYRNDVLRFVHPVGFGFIGITLLTMFINTGLTLKHVETIINTYKNYRWDAGLPSVWPDRVAVLNSAGDVVRNPITGSVEYQPAPNAGLDFPLRLNYNEENDDSIFQGQNPDERRKPMSPLFDQSSVTFSQWRDLVDKRLKDDIGNPRDPINPTQVQLNEQ
ncbi:baseplate wedge subunit [Pectobacterium bacteriophage PM2]|uniref:Baseplate wedge protein gp7 n=1 Tax=Pectobacterium bacteriophage PM2 TaxID=1429794 RepID=A0A0A0Q0S4_9CAUD|nr:baseplate wedge subunit [Pectobacterium bacteriophage PM2]AHY25138.1 base plate wedge initiator [Pectobacterium bacteriophage PM2]